MATLRLVRATVVHSFLKTKEKSMAILHPDFALTGTLGHITAYRVPNVNGVVVRRKGGVSAERIKKDKSYENTRRINSEFKGRAAFARSVMNAIQPLKALADYNIAGQLNALGATIQKLDKTSEWGKRNICATMKPRLLEGIILNKGTTLQSMVRYPFIHTLSKKDGTATVKVPALTPQENFFPNGPYSMYRIIAVLGVAPDLFSKDGSYVPSQNSYKILTPKLITTSWFGTIKGSPEIDLALSLSGSLPDENFSLVLGVGLAFGVPEDEDTIVQAKRGGAAQILEVV